jgi:hypothetical protein
MFVSYTLNFPEGYHTQLAAFALARGVLAYDNPRQFGRIEHDGGFRDAVAMPPLRFPQWGHRVVRTLDKRA